jgi:hypothetical protein
MHCLSINPKLQYLHPLIFLLRDLNDSELIESELVDELGSGSTFQWLSLITADEIIVFRLASFPCFSLKANTLLPEVVQVRAACPCFSIDIMSISMNHTASTFTTFISPRFFK